MGDSSGISPDGECFRSANPAERSGSARGAGGQGLREFIDRARRAAVPVRFEPRSSLDRLASSSAHQGVIALGAARKHADLESVASSEMLVLLDGVEHPHNLGAVIRTPPAAAARALTIPHPPPAGP